MFTVPACLDSSSTTSLHTRQCASTRPPFLPAIKPPFSTFRQMCSPPTMEWPKLEDFAGQATLPHELLAQIFSYLRPSARFYNRPDNPYGDLLNLSLANHHIGAAALRMLYDTAQVCSARSMIQILVNLIRYPERRNWIRAFSTECCCDIGFALPSDLEDIPSLPRTLSNILPPGEMIPTPS